MNNVWKVYAPKYLLKSIQTIKYCSDLMENWKSVAQCLITDIFFAIVLLHYFLAFGIQVRICEKSTLRVPYHGHAMKHACVHPGLVKLGFVLRQADVIQPPLTRDKSVSSWWWLIKLFALSALHHVALVLLLITIMDSSCIASCCNDSRVTQVKSSLLLASSTSEPRAWSASWSFFLWRGCLMPSSYNTHHVQKKKNTT